MMCERKKIINQVADFDSINTLWEVACNQLHLDAETGEVIFLKMLLALAWVTGAHQGLAFPEMTAALLADSDEVFQLVSDTWANIIGSSFPPEDIARLVQTAVEAEGYLPEVSLVPKDFSFHLKSN